jgi:hypothetical protein
MGGLTKTHLPVEAEKQSKYKRLFKKYGPWVIVFFCVKGIITLTLMWLAWMAII